MLRNQEPSEVLDFIGEPAGTRTQGPRLKRAMLYRLSYRLTQEQVNRQSLLVIHENSGTGWAILPLTNA